MPIAVNSTGWVKVPAPKVKRPSKPKDPLSSLRSPLAYITGRPEFKEPVKKVSPIEQYLIEAAPPRIEPIVEERAPRPHRSRRAVSEYAPEPESAPAPSVKSRHRRRNYEEADEEIPRPDLRPLDSQSQRSASPVGSRRGAPSVRSRRERAPTVYEDPVEVEPRRRRHVSSSVYDDELRYEPRKSYHRERDREERYYRQNYSTPHLAPAIQPIVIYSTPPAGGCGGHGHGCHAVQYQHQCYTQPQPMLAPPPVRAAIEPPRPAPSVVSSKSSGTSRSRPMSFKWYTATQPLDI